MHVTPAPVPLPLLAPASAPLAGMPAPAPAASGAASSKAPVRSVVTETVSTYVVSCFLFWGVFKRKSLKSSLLMKMFPIKKAVSDVSTLNFRSNSS